MELRGPEYYARLIRSASQGYDRVLMLGSSMGATAALVHAPLAHRVLAFGPRVSLERTHGSFLPAAARAECTRSVRAALHALSTRGGSAAVHFGRDNLEDVVQAECVAALAAAACAATGCSSAVSLVAHDTFQCADPAALSPPCLSPVPRPSPAAASRPSPTHTLGLPPHSHNVPMVLEREGRLVPLLKRELLQLLRGRRPCTDDAVE